MRVNLRVSITVKMESEKIYKLKRTKRLAEEFLMNFKKKTSFIVLFLLSQFLLVSVLSTNNSVLAASQTPTMSVNPSSFTVSNSNFTLYVSVSPLQNLNTIHFVLSFNNGPVFLNLTSSGIVAGDLFAGKQPSITVGSYYQNSTGRSYSNVLFELPATQTVSSSGVKNVANLTFGLLSNAMPGMQSVLNLESADALFYNGTNYEYVDERSGFTLQSGSLTLGYLTTTILANPTQVVAEKPANLSSTLKDGSGNPLSNMVVDYYIGTQKVGSGTTDIKGASSVQYTPLNVGSYTFIAHYAGNQPGGKYAQSNSTAPLTVVQLGTSLALSVPSSLKIGDLANLTATFKKADILTGGVTLSFSVLPPNGAWVSIGSAVTSASGVAQVTYTFTSIGSYGIKAEFAGTANLASCNDTATVSLSQSKTTMKLSITPTLTSKTGQTLTLSSLLMDENGNPLNGKTIDYLVNSQKVNSATTDASGSSSIQYTPSEASPSIGWKVEAKFAGEAAYVSSVDSLQIVVSQLSTAVNLNLVPSSITIGQKATLSASLKDENLKVLSGLNLDFYCSASGQWTKIGNMTTDSSGVASYDYVPSVTGSAQVKVEFAGSSKYASSSSDQIVLGVNMMPTTLVLNVPVAAKVDSQISLSGTLSDANQKAVMGVPIEYSYVSGGIEQSLGSAKTDQSGIASKIFVPSEAATVTITAKFPGDSNHTEASADILLTVTKVETSLTLVLSNSTVKNQNYVTLTAILTDSDNEPIDQTMVQFQVYEDGVWIPLNSVSTDIYGVASTVYKPDKAGSLPIKATYSGNAKYIDSISSEAILKVTEDNLLLFIIPSAIVAVAVPSFLVVRMKRKKKLE